MDVSKDTRIFLFSEGFAASLRGIKQQAGTSQSRFRLLEFTDFDGGHIEALGRDALFGERKRGRKNDGIADSQRIAGMRLGWIDVDPLEAIRP